MDDTIAGSTQVYSKSDGTNYDGMYFKRGTEAEKLVGNPAVAGSNGIIRYNDQTLDATVVIPNNKNAFSAGPLTIGSGKSVTIGTGSYWTII
tara:strand:+ start:881 stop:1156 length:276 start_codon:yes stop_codon:yes gene_type:complete